MLDVSIFSFNPDKFVIEKTVGERCLIANVGVSCSVVISYEKIVGDEIREERKEEKDSSKNTREKQSYAL